MPRALTETQLLCELDETSTSLVHRHLENQRLWMPHEQVDWSQGTSFQTNPWSEDQYPLSAGVRSSIYVNLLTEDNLPYYTGAIMEHAPSDHPLREWTQIWTMEENRHSMTMRDWVHISRCIDPVLLEEGRRVQMTTANVPRFPDLKDLMVYVTFQERATQIAHRNTGAKLPKEDKVGRSLLAVIAGDETKHHIFYRDLVAAALELDASTIIETILAQVKNFSMPGIGIPNFNRHAARIAREGIYTLSHFVNDVVRPTLEGWSIETRTALTDAAQRARDELRELLDTLSAQAEHMAERAALRVASAPAL